MIINRKAIGVFAFFVVSLVASTTLAQTLTLRIVTYNIEDDIASTIFGPPFSTDATTPLPGLISPYVGGTSTNGSFTGGGVLEGIGEEVLSDGVAHPPDIMNFEETSGGSTMTPIVTALNTYYSQYNPLAANMYAVTPYQATESGGATNDGNGPNSMVYNTKTVQLLASVPVDPPGGPSALGSSSGEYREVMRYEFCPAGQPTNSAPTFYIYVSHYKSGTTSTDANDRTGEAQIIRNNETTLLPGSRVIYVGDYNVDTSGEAGYQTILAATSPGGIGQGQGVDPLNVTNNPNINWESTTTTKSILLMLTEEDTELRYRDDLQLCTTNIFYQQAGGLCLITNTYHGFGNNGSLTYGASVNNTTNTALADIPAGAPISATQLMLDLTGASDHLPVVADYIIPIISPVAAFAATSATTNPAPSTVTFTDTSAGIITNWFWNFGDGVTTNIDTTPNATHTYTNTGIYTVTETVSGPGGTNSVTNNALITVLSTFSQWQLQYFGSTTAAQAQSTADADGTGQNNFFKYVAGLNPTNPASVFVFNVASVPNRPAEENLVFSPAEAGCTYTPLFSTNLLNGPWAPLTTITTVTSGSQITITDTNAIMPQGFYQIEISSPGNP
jgi:PKD repeat protein